MSDIVARLDGLPEFQRALQQIGQRVTTRVLRVTAAAGARVVRKAIRDAAPVGNYAGKRRGGGRVTPPGVLKNAIISKFARERSSADQATYLVTVRRGRGRGKGARAGDAYYARWVEEGHRIVPRRGGSFLRGSSLGVRRIAAGISGARTRPFPFHRPGTEASAGAATRAMQQRMAEELVKVLK